MYTRTVTYTDYDGNERTEEFRFHMNKAEIMQWLTCNGGYTLDKQLKMLYEASRGKDVMEIFEDLMKRSYGKKSLDGRRFDKSDEIWNDFKATDAYSIIYSELIADAKKSAAFFNSIMPRDMMESINKIMEENAGQLPDEVKDYATSDVLNEKGELTPFAEMAAPPKNNVTPILQNPV